MSVILDAPRADDYVVATGDSRSVRDFVAAAFRAVGIEDWESHVEVDRDLFRPADPRSLVGDAARLRSLGWKPSLDFDELVRILVEAQVAAVASEEG